MHLHLNALTHDIFKSNATATNYFTIFLQTIDMANSSNMGPLLISHLCLSMII